MLAQLLSIATMAAVEPLLVGYVPLWTEVAGEEQQLDFSKVTHVNLAFLNPADEAGTLAFEPKAAGLVTQAHAQKVKVLISLGGGSASEDAKMRARYERLLDGEHRAAFVKSLGDYVAAHQFDGIDVDLEGPAIRAGYAAFIEELAAALRPTRLLTAALSKGYGGNHVPVATLRHFDWVNIMAYDATGPWDKDHAGPHSSFEFAKQNVAWWLDRGLKPAQAVLGLPFYGYGFGETGAKQRHWRYREIVAQWPGASGRDESGATVYYNGIPTIEAKCRLVQEKQLAGVMVWTLTGDATGPDSLLGAARNVLTKAKPSP